MDIRISDEGPVTTLVAHHNDRRLIGIVVVDAGTVMVASIRPEFQGKGHYPNFLRLLAAFSYRENSTVLGIRSSDAPSPHAVKAWRYAGASQSLKGWWFL